MQNCRRVGRLLVTGARGFVGEHVALAVGHGAFGDDASFLATPEGWDIRDEVAVTALLEELQPDSILHLAAQSFVPRSFEDPRETFEINVLGTLNLLSASRATGFSGRFVYASSGDVYGTVPEESLPVDERRWPEPRNPYAASKLAAEQLCLQWGRSEALDVVIARPFNHVGPGQDGRFVLPSLALQVRAIAEGRQIPVVQAGDLDATRDFTDVRDVVSAYAALLERGLQGMTYVIGSGQERKVRDLLLMLCEIAGVQADIRQDPTKLRPSEQRRMRADFGRLQRDTGWTPKIPIEKTLEDILKQSGSNP